MARFCWLCIPGFAELAALLYILTKNRQSFYCEEEEQWAFDAIKQALPKAPALGLFDTSRLFQLVVA